MKLLNETELVTWCGAHNIVSDRNKYSGNLFPVDTYSTFPIPPLASKHLWFCRVLEKSLRPWTRSLLIINTWSIWESSENWHLFYRLRQSYGDSRLIEEASSHLFMDYEGHDLVSFLQITISAGWDFSLFSHENYSHVIGSHDGSVKVCMTDDADLERLRNELG